MKRLIVTALIALMAILPLPAAAQNGWASVAALLAKAAVSIENTRGFCTGFVIHPTQKDKDKGDVDYVATAAHCDGAELYADQSPAEIVSKDIKKDIMVLRVEDTGRPGLALAKDNPKVGDEVASFGWGYALDKPMFRVTHVSADNIYIPFEGIGGPLTAVDTSFVPGMSGGPVVNQAGEVVMIVQLGTETVGFGVASEIIRDKIGKHFSVK